MVMCVAQKIGPIKASLIHWNGTTGEDLRRARRDRPSIGWHDPWRAELCDAKAKVAWVSSERKGSQELAAPLTPRLHAVRMRTNMTPHDHDDDHNDDGGRSSATPSHCARRKRPAHFPTSQLDFGRQLSFSPYARAVESRCWPTM